jgi:hypothetical protein
MAITEYFSANDPFSFASQISVLFPNSGLRLSGHPSTGRLVAHIPKARYSQIKVAKNHQVVVDSKILSASEAQTYQKIFNDLSNAKDIPWILGPASLIPVIGTVITIMTSSVDGLYRLTKTTVSSDQFSVLMAKGGAFIRTIGVDDIKSVGEVLTSIIYYTVKVGDEVRLFGVYSAAYGLSVD